MKSFKIPMSSPSFDIKESNAVLKVLKSGWLSEGKVTKQFEKKLSDHFSSNIVTVNNGSSAIMCSLLAHGIKPGDKIVIPAFTFIATSSIPRLLGAKIIISDVDPKTFNMTPTILEKIVKKTKVKAVIIVDVGGLSTDLDKFVELSKKYRFILIEDAAEALGSEYKKRKIGSFKHTTIFSFHIAKQITTVEGGCISTGIKEILENVIQIKNHGRLNNKNNEHQILGTNFRTTDIQSALGIVQLQKFKKHLEHREKIAKFYKNNIKTLEFQEVPKYATKHSYMLFFALASNKNQRDRIVHKLNSKGIDARNVWTPINLQQCNKDLKFKRCLNAEEIFKRALILPIYNSMTLEDAEYVVNYL